MIIYNKQLQEKLKITVKDYQKSNRYRKGEKNGKGQEFWVQMLWYLKVSI